MSKSSGRTCLLWFVLTVALSLLGVGLIRGELAQAQESAYLLPACSVVQYSNKLIPSPNFAADKTLFLLTDWHRRLGVLRSMDDGETWLQVHDYSYSTGSAAFNSFEIAPTRTTTDLVFYLGVDHGDYPTGSGYFFHRTNDGGNTWEQVTSPCSEHLDCPGFSLRATNRSGVVFQPRRWFFDPGLPEGVVRTADGGITWQQVWSETAANTVAVSPNFNQDETVFALLAGLSPTLDASFIISHDAGETWSGGGQGLCLSYIPDLVVSPGFARDHTLLASAYGSSLYMSQDSGLNWRSIFPPGEPYCHGSEYGAIDPQFSPGYPEDPTLYAATGRGLYASYDAGQSWTLLVPNSASDLVVRSTPEREQSRGNTPNTELLTDNVNRVYLPLTTVQGSGPPYKPHTLFMRAQITGTYDFAQYRSDDGGWTWQCMDIPAVRRQAYFPLLRIRS